MELDEGTSNLGSKIFFGVMIILILVGVGLLITGIVKFTMPKDDEDKGTKVIYTATGGLLIGVPVFMLIVTYVFGY